jgi:organic radical activating enzyme
MSIVSVNQRWPKNKLRVELMLGNLCNYSCWYCFPGSNEGTDRWPDYKILSQNLKHLFNYYKTIGKDIFEIHLIGGEPTLWANLGEFVKELKSDHNCIISMSSNASRTLRWWQEYGKYFDKVILSAHYEKINIPHYIDVADCLYDQKVIVTGIVLMDPANWQTCIDIVAQLKTSKRRWGIDVQEILLHNKTVEYTDEQRDVLKKHRLRRANPFWFLSNNKHTLLHTTVTHTNGISEVVKSNEIVLNKWNQFKDWDCNLGIDSIYIDSKGLLTGACGNKLYNLNYNFDLRSADFIEKFNPTLTSTICQQEHCFCQPEANLTKHKIIPIIQDC